MYLFHNVILTNDVAFYCLIYFKISSRLRLLLHLCKKIFNYINNCKMATLQMK